jgi:hypothetical protein
MVENNVVKLSGNSVVYVVVVVVVVHVVLLEALQHPRVRLSEMDPVVDHVIKSVANQSSSDLSDGNMLGQELNKQMTSFVSKID